MSDRQNPNGTNPYPEGNPEETKQFPSGDPFASSNAEGNYSSAGSAEPFAQGAGAQGGFDSNNPHQVYSSQQIPGVDAGASAGYGSQAGFDGQVGYGAQPGYGAPMPQPRTNSLAIGSLITGIIGFFILLTSPVAVILGHMSLSKIKKTGENGRGLAIAGLVLGYLGTVVLALTIAVLVWLVRNPDKMDEYFGDLQAKASSEIAVTSEQGVPGLAPEPNADEANPEANPEANAAVPGLFDEDPLREPRCAALNDLVGEAFNAYPDYSVMEEAMQRLANNQSNPEWKAAIETYLHSDLPTPAEEDAYDKAIGGSMLDCEANGYSIEF